MLIPLQLSTLSYRYADKTNYLTGISHTVPDLGISNKLDFTYGNLANGQMPDQIYSVKWNDVTKKAWSYDGLGRIKSESVYPSVGHSLQSTYTYKDATGNTTTTLVSGVQSSLGDYSYQYDANGNITRIDYNNLRVATSALTQYQVNYEYDEFNQLVRCYGDNISYGGIYTYDDNGNITSKNNNTYGYTNSVWGDLLTSYNGNTITYDTIGNPLTYKNGETFMWQNGRRLNMILDGNDITAVYNYDVSGSRISKSTEAGDTFFTYVGDILDAQKTGNNILVWIYDNDGKYIGFTYNGVEYYYVYNLQGDVEAIADSNGTIIARYTYDPWGKIVAITDAALNDISTNASHIANINPIRYRGYYYDTETGFYYVSSRYYDPEIGRWINADGFVSTGQGVLGYNMFAYCGNNPVNRVDHTGQFWSEIWEFAKTAVAEIGKAMGVMSPAYAGCGGAAVADGPLPFGDIVAAAGAALLTVGAIGYGIYQATQAPAISVPKVEEKSKDIVIPKEPDNPVIFPVDPNTFNPVGLVKVPRAGTKNGAFISWMDPLTNTEVFRWDENPNYSNGPHYHIHGTGHYYPGMIVPEPYATMYFPVG